MTEPDGATEDAGDTLYFYVEGSDLDAIASTVRDHLERFVAERTWVARDVRVVDQVDNDDPSLRPGDLPSWDLGLNVRFDGPPSTRPANWFDDVEAIIELLRALSAETGRAFVLGAAFEGRAAEDLFSLDASPADLDQIRYHLGASAQRSALG